MADVMNSNERVNLNDHDLVVVIHTQMQRVLLDIKEIKDTTISRITMLEANVVYKKDAETESARLIAAAGLEAQKLFDTKSATDEDVETRLRSLEKTQTQTLTWGTVAILAIGVLEFLIIHFVK